MMSNLRSKLLHTVRLNFRAGEVSHTFDAVYLVRNFLFSLVLSELYDSLPTGSPVGTAIMLHGCPGSHDDFKYITPHLEKKGIRVVAPNFPGYGYTEDLLDLQHNNAERNGYVTALLDHLNLKEKIVFVGHSRGTENAIMLSVLNEKRTAGAILVNPMGLRPHRGIRPNETFSHFVRMYNDADAESKIQMEQNVLERFGASGSRLANGRAAASCMMDIATMALQNQAEWIDKLNQRPHIRVLIASGGKDALIEPEITRELADKVAAKHDIVVSSKEVDEEASATEDMRLAFTSKSQKAVVVEFTKDDHFVQKHRASFIAEAVEAMLSAVSNNAHKLSSAL